MQTDLPAHPDMLSALCEVSDTLDRFVDVVDGTEGDGPQPNWAMRLKSIVDEAIAKAEGVNKSVNTGAETSTDKFTAALRVVTEQADDDGLWFIARTAPEAYLQRELRRLHAAIEGKSPDDCARAALSLATEN